MGRLEQLWRGRLIRREVINMLIEVPLQVKINERWREIINRLIE